MRREWTGWIKNRQWSEFEKVAKTDPCQALADTVAELELGFPDKPDRKALRKVLFLLSQAGFRPGEIDEDYLESREPLPPLQIAFMMSPDSVGDSVVTLARESHGKVAWLVTHLSYPAGISRASEDATTLEDAQTRIHRLHKMSSGLVLSAQVPFEFAVARLARAVAMTKMMPPAIAYWRASLPKEVAETHPADELPRSKMTREDPGTLLMGPDPKIPWRFEMGALTPALKELMEQRKHSENSVDGSDPKTWDLAMASSRAQLFTPELIAEHRLWLLDLAYLMHLKNDPEFGNILATADDLREVGSESFYARAMTTKSLLILVNTLKERNATERAAR